MSCRALLALLALAALALALGGCQRAVPDERAAAYEQANAQYPWQVPDWARETRKQSSALPTDQGTFTGQDAVAMPTDKGHHPAFPEHDTLNPAVLPGDWLLAGLIVDEKDMLVPPAQMSIFKFQADGTFTLVNVVNGEVAKTSPGTWEKSGPGRLLVAYQGGSPYTFWTQMDGTDFMFLWTFEGQNGLWLVRRPAQASPHILVNDFTFTSGEHLHLAQVGADSFTGSITGAVPMEVTGSFSQGVMNLRWIDRTNNVDGYAAFAVTPDWKEMQGVWWLSDFTSAPFGGHWQTKGAVPTAIPQAGTPTSHPAITPPPAATPPTGETPAVPVPATPPATPPAAPPTTPPSTPPSQLPPGSQA